MKEKEIRDRIRGFLKRTARTVAVPASVGLGLSAGACDRTSLNGRPADAATDSAKLSDAVVVSPDTNVASPDLALGADLPELFLPYVVVMAPDARVDLQPIDSSPADAQTDVASPPPPYMVPPFPAPPSPGGTAPLPPKQTK